MYEKLNIKDIEGNRVNANMITLSGKYIDNIMELQETIFESIEDKSIFAKTGREEFEDMINRNGEVIGVVTEKGDLIAFGAMVIPGLEEFNLGYDLNFTENKLLYVAHMESTVVHSNYRGNCLQRKLCDGLEEAAKEKGCTILCATVAPNNKFSLRTFLSLDYKIALEKEKYGGLKRYIVIKETPSHIHS